MGRLRGDEEGMRNAAREEHHAALADVMLLAADVGDQLALQDIDQLVLVRMEVERRRLAPDDSILEDHHRAARLGGAHLHREDAAAGEPEPLAFTCLSNHHFAHDCLLWAWTFVDTIVP